MAEAGDDILPAIDAQRVVSQDVGAPTSSNRDKSEFELGAGLFFDVCLPVRRRNGRRKSQAAQAKLIHIVAKRRFTVDKTTVEAQSAVAALFGFFAAQADDNASLARDWPAN